MEFDSTTLKPALYAADGALDIDTLAFGLIGFNAEDEVVAYNTAETAFAKLSKETVIGKDLFSEVAPCMNNFMVAERFEEEESLDEVIDYVLTLKMRPTKVRMRLMKQDEESTRYIAILPAT